MDDRALPPSVPVEHRKVLVDVGKGVGHAVGPVEFEQIRPHVIGRPVFDGPNGARRWDGAVSVEVGIHPGVGVHGGFAGSAFIEARAQQKVDDRGIAKHIGMFLDKPLSRSNLHAVRAPPEVANRRWITSPG